jgi:hypothetical protein
MISPGPTVDVVLKRFEAPDEVRNFTRGRFELVTIGGMTIGRAMYQPGWKWSVWVVGEEPYVSLHFLGANHYAK